MKKILASDDHQDNLITIKAILKNYMPDCEVFTANSGIEGIDTARKVQPDTILLDIIMPQMDGFDVCRKLKADESTKHVPIIMLTAIRTDSESRVKGLEFGADAFLAKPIEPNELSAQINVMLRIKEAEDKLRAEKDILDELVKERTKELRLEITKQKQTEKALKESEAFIKVILDNLPIGLAVNSINPTVIFSYMNDNFPKYYRTTRDKLTDPDAFWEAVYEDPEFRKKMKKKILADCADNDLEQMHWEEIPITRKGEKTFFIEARNVPLPGKQLMISTVWDVTKRKEAEETLNKRMVELEIFNEATVNRELKINDLRKEINELLVKHGEEEKYVIVV